MIELDNVTKRYGTKVAVEDLTLRVPAGELFAFLGPNGAGKTTTIKMLCGLLFPTPGTVRVGGFDLRTAGRPGPAAHQLRPGPAVPVREADRPRVPPVHRRPVRHAAATAPPTGSPTVIELFHLDEFVDDLTERYSHGMRQRTVFAAALVHEPKLLIADEPTVGLDPKSIRELKTLLRQQADERARRCSSRRTRWTSPRSWPTASASSTTAGCSAAARWPTCGSRRRCDGTSRTCS